ncbi:MAG: serine hydrolase domain-containing protein [Actinomycetota bacterium]
MTERRGPRSRIGVLAAVAILAAACGTDTRNGAAGANELDPTGTSTTATASTTGSTPATTTTTTTLPSTTTTTTTTTTPSSTTTIPTTTTATTTTTTPVSTHPPARSAPPAADPSFAATQAAFDPFVRANLGASISVARAGEVVFEYAAGPRVDGDPATASTPMLVASVSKLMTAATVARLAERGDVDLDAPMPWWVMGIAAHPEWLEVTPRELLGHAAGMPVARPEWFRGGATCEDFLPTLVAAPPTATRGRWTYSNGNYCALGLLLEHVTGRSAVEAVFDELFAPLGLSGLHSTELGLLPGDMQHPKRVERLSRLGAAGTFIVSTNDLALALSHLSDAEIATLGAPSVFTDQYGLGHTGTIEGAKACTWILQGGATVVSAAISGDSVGFGGVICDRVLPALAIDLGLPSVEPRRWP